MERGGDRIELTGIILKGRYCIMERIGMGVEGDLFEAAPADKKTVKKWK